MRLLGLVIAGGSARRMGFEKTFARIGGRTILERIITTLSPQVDSLIINANGDSARFADTCLAVVADLRPEIGTPLAGIHAGLRMARRDGFAAVLTVPSDCPFLPADLATRLSPGPSVAASGGMDHVLTGLWPVNLLQSLEDGLDSGLRRVKDWAAICRARSVEWPVSPFDPFLNLNTPADLAEAERIARQEG